MTEPLEIWSNAEATLYRASLLADPAKYWSLLSQDEKTRAESCGNLDIRRRFVVRRGLLRALLAEHLHISPAPNCDAPGSEVQFHYSPKGKPFVIGSPIHFSVSSSQNEAAFLISLGGPVGVDVEKIDDNFAFESLLEFHFSKSERDLLTRVPADRRHICFFQSWTRKEACVKALGVGITVPTFDIERRSNLAVTSIETADGYAIAVAVGSLDPQAEYRLRNSAT